MNKVVVDNSNLGSHFTGYAMFFFSNITDSDLHNLISLGCVKLVTLRSRSFVEFVSTLMYCNAFLVYATFFARYLRYTDKNKCHFITFATLLYLSRHLFDFHVVM